MSNLPKDLRELSAEGGNEAVRKLAFDAVPFTEGDATAESSEPWVSYVIRNERPERVIDWKRYFEAATIDLAKTRGMDADEIRETLPPPVVHGILRQGSVAILAGASKVRKSWMALHMALCYRTQASFLGFKVAGGRVRYLDFELKSRTAAGRYALARLGITDDVEIQALIDNEISFHAMRSMASEEGTLRGIAEWMTIAGKPGELWFLDCLQPVLEVDQNDNVKLRGEFKPLMAAAETSGVALVIVDHYNKSNEARGMARISGGVAKVAAVDAVITLSPENDVIRVNFDLREDPPVQGEVLAKFNSITHGFDLVSSEDAHAAALEREKERMFDLIGRGWNDGSEPKTRDELAKAWGYKARSAVSNELEKLMMAGLVIEGEKRKQAKTYQLSLVSGDSERQLGI